MSNVTITIAGRRYTIACAEGEESHIEKLGAQIDGKIADLPNISAQSEARILLYAALVLADEIHEAKGVAAAPTPAAPAAANLAEPLEAMAERLESLASQLEAAA